MSKYTTGTNPNCNKDIIVRNGCHNLTLWILCQFYSPNSIENRQMLSQKEFEKKKNFAPKFPYVSSEASVN